MKFVIRTAVALLICWSFASVAVAASPASDKSAKNGMSEVERKISLDLIEDIEDAWALAILDGDLKQADLLEEIIVELELFVFDDLARLLEKPSSNVTTASLGSGR